MPKTNSIEFDYNEVAEALILNSDIHEGLWGISIKFGIQGANIETIEGSGNVTPSAIVPILKLGLQRFDKPNNLTVDASKVNPKK